MSTCTLLKNACYCANLRSRSKDGIIGEMVHLAVRTGRLRRSKELLQAIQEGVREGTIGLVHGVAILHGGTDAVDDFVFVVALQKRGVAFDAFDGEPSRIFVLIVHPPGQTDLYLRHLSALTKLLRRSQIRERLLEAKSPAEMIRALTERAGMS